VLNEARIAQHPDHNAYRQTERSHCRVSKNARVTACLVDPGKKVGSLFRRLVVDFRAAESAYVCRYIDRLLAVGALEDIKIFGGSVKNESICHCEHLLR
jgi:hypothetical protein